MFSEHKVIKLKSSNKEKIVLIFVTLKHTFINLVFKEVVNVNMKYIENEWQ